jgi:hypothetical protein
MGEGRDAMLMVRAQLCDRLAALSNPASPLSVRDFGARLQEIRSVAAAYGLLPVVRLADALERAVAGSDAAALRGCPTMLYLVRLQDAIGCDTADERTSQTLLASISVRLGA